LVGAPTVGPRHRCDQDDPAKHGQPWGCRERANLWRHLVDADSEQLLRLRARRCLGRGQLGGDINANADSSDNTHSDPDNDAYTHTNGHPHTDTNSSRNTHTNSNPHPDTNSSRNAHTDGHPHTDANSSRNAYSNSHPHADIHADSYSPANGHTYAFNSRYFANTNAPSNGNPNPNRFSWTVANTFAYGDSEPFSHVCTYSDT
jgi:hypothetical protein